MLNVKELLKCGSLFINFTVHLLVYQKLIIWAESKKK